MSKLAVCFTTLCMVAAPSMAAPANKPTLAETSQSPERTPASSDELAQYAERERAAEQQASYEGGRRGRGVETTTIIIILLVVILVLILI